MFLGSRISTTLYVIVIACVILSGCAMHQPEALGPFPEPPLPPKGFASDEEVMAAIQSGQVKLLSMTPPVPDTVIEHKDIEYGKVGERALLLDLYLPKTGRKPFPGLIFIHGGGWQGGHRRDYLVYCLYFAEKGYAAATISYRFSSEATYPAAVEDAKCAVRWMRANAVKYAIDPGKIAILGGSAGGYLALMVGLTSDVAELEGNGGNPDVSSRVQAVVNFYGPSDLTAPVAQAADVVKRFLGKSYEEEPELYKQASPLTYIDPEDPPVLIHHGTVDTIVPVEQSDVLAGRLTAARVPVVYNRLEGWPHTMDLAEVVNVHCRFYLDHFLETYLHHVGKGGR